MTAMNNEQPDRIPSGCSLSSPRVLRLQQFEPALDYELAFGDAPLCGRPVSMHDEQCHRELVRYGPSDELKASRFGHRPDNEQRRSDRPDTRECPVEGRRVR
jgi:hypothetical protein